MYLYNSRIYDCYRQPVLSLAVLADEQAILVSSLEAFQEMVNSLYSYTEIQNITYTNCNPLASCLLPFTFCLFPEKYYNHYRIPYNTESGLIRRFNVNYELELSGFSQQGITSVVIGFRIRSPL
ncbi:hypothetical protein PN462_15705 [Spirulina sp. CS-785/01]|uniref:hypothetical protein n=1 Tax=Spirulina sp. CS-785/01 TaxID=3021716 RepID=UPI0023315554|nr:hypothetical protein [Spirulina sp. CS-785/01]MDB9314556.1 hypothetical protein [Spirulina sp. CS-785/01]